MHVIIKKFTVLFSSLLAVNLSLGEISDWRLESDKDGIRTYTRDVAGSDYREFKSEMLIAATSNQLLGLLDDTSACPQWMHNCLAPLLLDQRSTTERYTYMRNDLPWPYADRELVIHSSIVKDTQNNSITIFINGISNDALPLEVKAKLPVSKRYVRVKSLRGFWRFVPQGDKQRVSYQLHIDLGGSPSPALANTQITDTPLYTLINMRKLLQGGAYKDFELPAEF